MPAAGRQGLKDSSPKFCIYFFFLLLPLTYPQTLHGQQHVLYAHVQKGRGGGKESLSVAYKINTCYISEASRFPNPSGRARLKERESTAGGFFLFFFLVSALSAPVRLGPSSASAPRRASALHRQTNTHTLTAGVTSY